MVSAISSVGSSNTQTAGASRPDTASRVAEAESRVDAKKIEIAQCSCADTRQSLREELSMLQADLNSALAEGSGKTTTASPADGARQLSGESDRIGTVNFDEETPFGKRVGYF